VNVAPPPQVIAALHRLKQQFPPDQPPPEELVKRTLEEAMQAYQSEQMLKQQPQNRALTQGFPQGHPHFAPQSIPAQGFAPSLLQPHPLQQPLHLQQALHPLQQQQLQRPPLLPGQSLLALPSHLNQTHPNEQKQPQNLTGSLPSTQESSSSNDAASPVSSGELDNDNGGTTEREARVAVAAIVKKVLYEAKTLSREDFRTICKKAVEKVIVEWRTKKQATESLTVNEFITSKRRAKIRGLVEKYIERL
jgi:hypothetical protein